MLTPFQSMKLIHDQLNDLTITEPQAQLLAQFFEQSIALLEALQNPGHDLFEQQKRTLLKGLLRESALYQQGYWGKTERVEKINGFMQARGQLHFLLSQAMATSKLKGPSQMSKNVWAMLNF